MELEDRIRGFACAAVDGCAASRITGVSRFESGDRHAVHKVSYLDADDRPRAVVVRVSLVRDDREIEQAAREARVLRVLGGAAAPALLDFRVASQWFDTPAMCIEFVAGVQRDVAASPAADIERLGAAVARVHALPVDELLDLRAVGPAASTYLDWRIGLDARKLPLVRDPLPATVQQRIAAAWSEITTRVGDARSPGDATPVLLHGDVTAGNIVWGSEPVLIDWEYARLGDPADEVAYVFGQNGLDGGQREAFWRGYRQSGASPAAGGLAARVGWWEPMNLLGSALWWIERWSTRVEADAAGRTDPAAPRSQEDYLDEALWRLSRVEQLLGRTG